MKTKLFIATISVLFNLRVNAQVMFQKTYGGANLDHSLKMSNASDGGYIIAGVTKSFGAGEWDICVNKTDSLGTMQWNAAVGGPLGEHAFSIQPTYDGNYVIVGYTFSFGAGGGDALLFKMDASGNILWAKTWGGIYDDGFQWVQQTADSGFILLGWTNSYGAGNGDMYLVKTDSLGNTEWIKTYGSSTTDAGESVIQTSDGGFLLVGYTFGFGVSAQEAYVIKTDPSGNLLWSRTYGAAMSELFFEARELKNNTAYALLGITDSYSSGGGYDAWLTKIDPAGNVLWSERYSGTPGLPNAAYGLEIKSNDEFLIAGGTRSFTNDPNAYLLCSDTNGIVIWGKIYGTPGIEGAGSCKQTADGGYVLSANIGYGDMYLVKTDNMGNSGCNEANAPFVSSSLNIVSLSVNTLDSTGGISNSVLLPTQFNGLTDTTFCTTPVSVNELYNVSNVLTCYPNPFTETTTIQINSEKNYSDLVIYDLFGQKIKAIHNATDKKIKFDRNNLSAGLYFICLIQNNQTVATSKLIISGE